MSLLYSLLLVTALQSACCQQSFSYPVLADVAQIEVSTRDNVTLKEIKDGPAIDSIVRFIDERRSRWCSPTFSMPAASARLVFYKSQGGHGEIGLGNGFLVAQLADGKYLLEISPEEQRAFFKLLDINEASLFKR